MPLTSSRSSTEANGPFCVAVLDDRGGGRRPDARQLLEFAAVAWLRSIGPVGASPAASGAVSDGRHDLADHRDVDPLPVDERRGEVQRRPARPAAVGPPAASMASTTRAPLAHVVHPGLGDRAGDVDHDTSTPAVAAVRGRHRVRRAGRADVPT